MLLLTQELCNMKLGIFCKLGKKEMIYKSHQIMKKKVSLLFVFIIFTLSQFDSFAFRWQKRIDKVLQNIESIIKTSN